MMKSLTTILVVLLFLVSCQDQKQVSSYSTTGSEVEMIKSKFDDYHKGNWENWVNYYADSAKVYYNTRRDPMTAKEAAEMHKNSVVPLSTYEFDDDILVEKIINHEGIIKVFFRGYWKAQLAGNGKDFEIPTQVYYHIKNGKIIEEHGFWDNAIYVNAYNEMMAIKAEEK